MTSTPATMASVVDLVQGPLASLEEAVALGSATSYARRGEYARAETALHRAPETTEVLDLRAKICAQQGRFEEAAILWSRAAEMDPANSMLHRAADRAARDASRDSPLVSGWRTIRIAVLAVAFVALLIVAFVLFIYPSMG